MLLYYLLISYIFFWNMLVVTHFATYPCTLPCNGCLFWCFLVLQMIWIQLKLARFTWLTVAFSCGIDMELPQSKKVEYVSSRRTKIIRIQVNYGEPGIADHEVSGAPHQPHNPRKNNTTTFWMFLFVFEGGVFQSVIALMQRNFDGNLKANFHLQLVFCRVEV